MDQKQLRYTRDHEWIGMDGDLAVVGITDHAQAALGDITFIELPVVGKALKAHDVLGVVESVKAASDIYAPVAGTVKAVNAALNDKPELVNQQPYGEGWICKLADVSAAELAGLMTAADYEAFCASEA
ncbi:MAG: glycine cleavage system protein GcvH [Kiritimatiellae bacterium]|nr:glycine cleavage system protein GcvH [Kiritimatiellia bacterium]